TRGWLRDRLITIHRSSVVLHLWTSIKEAQAMAFSLLFHGSGLPWRACRTRRRRRSSTLGAFPHISVEEACTATGGSQQVGILEQGAYPGDLQSPTQRQ